MSEELAFTEDELAELDAIVTRSESKRQMERIEGRLALPKFIAKHGKPKCDLIWAEIRRRDYLKNPAAHQIRGS